MADKKISALTASSTPLAGTEVLPIVQGGSTVKVSVANLTAGRVVSASGAAVNATFKAWSVVNAYQVGTGASFGGGVGFADGFATCNSYYDGATWRRIAAVGASQVALTPSTGIRFNVASSGAADSAMSWTEVGSFSALTDFTVNTGNVVIGTAGKGIDFSANTHAAGMTSELLNDYEEGTFTPVIAGSSSAGTANYVAQAGSYTKIGRAVYFQVYLSWDSGTGTGDLYVSGLPFLSSGAPYGVASTAYQLNIALSANSYSTGGYVLSSNTSVRLMQSTVAGGGVSSIPYDAAGEFMMSGSYFV